MARTSRALYFSVTRETVTNVLRKALDKANRQARKEYSYGDLSKLLTDARLVNMVLKPMSVELEGSPEIMHKGEVLGIIPEQFDVPSASEAPESRQGSPRGIGGGNYFRVRYCVKNPMANITFGATLFPDQAAGRLGELLFSLGSRD